MTIKRYCSGLFAFLKAKLFKKGVPIVIHWAITYQCNSYCGYCQLPKKQGRELSTKQIFKVIDFLSKKGTRIINFTGGEPLIRQDIIDILIYAKEKGIDTVLNTNGILLSEKKEVLNYVKMVKLSFDGPINIHDKIRGSGAFKSLMQAIKIVKASKSELLLCTVLSKYNSDSVEYILDLAKKIKGPVFFQPVTKQILGGSEANPLFFEIEEYRKVIIQLLRLKKTKFLAKYIANSSAALKYLYDWPEISKIRCAAGLVFCHISADGYLMRCSSNQDLCELRNVDSVEKFEDAGKFFQSFEKLNNHNPVSCRCPGLIECNYLFSFNLSAISNLVKMKLNWDKSV